MYKTETYLAQLGNRSETATGTVNPPVYFSTAFRHEGIGQSTGFDYTRTGNPTRQLLERSSPMRKKAIKVMPAVQEWQPFLLYWPYLNQMMHGLSAKIFMAVHIVCWNKGLRNGD